MNGINILMISIMLLVSSLSMTQERIIEKQNKVLHLKTMNFEVIEGTNGTNYYKHLLYSGYKYPNIKKGFYSQNIFVNGDDLINFYKELIKISKMDDGMYKLSKKYGDVSKVDKKRNKKIKVYFIIYYNQSPRESTSDTGFAGTAKIKFLEEDLNTIENYINK